VVTYLFETRCTIEVTASTRINTNHNHRLLSFIHCSALIWQLWSVGTEFPLQNKCVVPIFLTTINPWWQRFHYMVITRAGYWRSKPHDITPIFIARQHTDARYWYSNSVCPSVCLSVRNVPVSNENGLTYRHSFFTIR